MVCHLNIWNKGRFLTWQPQPHHALVLHQAPFLPNFALPNLSSTPFGGESLSPQVPFACPTRPMPQLTALLTEPSPSDLCACLRGSLLLQCAQCCGCDPEYPRPPWCQPGGPVCLRCCHCHCPCCCEVKSRVFGQQYLVAGVPTHCSGAGGLIGGCSLTQELPSGRVLHGSEHKGVPSLPAPGFRP